MKKPYKNWSVSDFRAYRAELDADMDREISDLRAAHAEAGSPLDSEWSLDLSIDGVVAMCDQLWEQLIVRASHAGCQASVLDAVEAW